MAMYVLGYKVGIHFYSMVPQFSTVYFVSVKFGINNFTDCSLCQDTISTYKLSIYVKSKLETYNRGINIEHKQIPKKYFNR